MLFFIGLIPGGVGEAYATRRREREWLENTWGTYENFRASVDIWALRKVKYTRGKFAALRLVRKQYPNLAIEYVQALVNEL